MIAARDLPVKTGAGEVVPAKKPPTPDWQAALHRAVERALKLAERGKEPTHFREMVGETYAQAPVPQERYFPEGVRLDPEAARAATRLSVNFTHLAFETGKSKRGEIKREPAEIVGEELRWV